MTDLNKSKFFALLIGINYYESVQTYPQLYKNLGGCVRDIDLVANYLKTTLGVPEQQIWMLTAPVEESNQLGAIRAAAGNTLPNYANIVNAFAAITAAANSGDQVYIHYSGHGGRAVTIYPELEGADRKDESIVPMDIGSADGRYLRDVEIATLLKRLTVKGCIITVIFDSCHSGGATRKAFAIRGSENNEIDRNVRSSESLVASREELIENWKLLTQADPQLSTGWLPNSDDYVFLAACRPLEFAYEYPPNGKERYGALTYWIMDTLTSSTTALTFNDLYGRVRNKIQSEFPQQQPVLFGDGNQEIFSSDRQKSVRRCVFKPYTVKVLDIDQAKQTLTLDSGLAGGLSSGTRLAIYPYKTPDLEDRTKQIAIVELTNNIQADRATAIILTPEAGGIEVKKEIESGDSAVIVATPVNLIHKVCLFDGKVAGDREQDLPSELVEQQIPALTKVRQALMGNGWIKEAEEDEASHFQIAVSSKGTYEICTGMPIKNISELKINKPDSARQVVNRLVHLIKYQAVKKLDNPASSLTSFLDFQICDQEKKLLSDSPNVSLVPEAVYYLKVKNNYSETLNIAVLDIEATWEISQIPLQGISSSFTTLDSGQEVYTSLRFRVFDDYEDTTEILKLFATKGLANFRWLTLPALDQKFRTRGNTLNQEITTRAVGQAINPLNNLLTAIGSDVDNPPDITRAMVYSPSVDDEWVTKEISITVTK